LLKAEAGDVIAGLEKTLHIQAGLAKEFRHAFFVGVILGRRTFTQKERPCLLLATLDALIRRLRDRLAELDSKHQFIDTVRERGIVAHIIDDRLLGVNDG